MSSVFPLVMSIDPSQRYLGIAVRTSENKLLRLMEVEQTTANHVDWRRRAAFMATTVKNLVEELYAETHIPIVIVMETPNNWHTERGQDSKNSEAVQKLYNTVGVITGSLRELPCIDSIWTVFPNQWKGQADKDKMTKRFVSLAEHHFIDVSVDISIIDDDAVEAAMLAQWSHGKQYYNDDELMLAFYDPLQCIYDSRNVSEGTFKIEQYIRRNYDELESIYDQELDTDDGKEDESTSPSETF